MSQPIHELTLSLAPISMSSQRGMVLQSADGKVQSCNQVAQEILGLTLEQLQEDYFSNSPLIQVDGSPFTPENHPAMVTLRTGKPCTNVVMGMYKPSGELIWLMIYTEPLLGEGSTPSAVVSTFVEISEQIRSRSPLVTHPSEENGSELLSEEAFFFARSLDLLAVIGLDGYFKRVNPMFIETLGYSENELLAHPFIDFVHPDDRPATLAEVEKLNQGMPTLDFENRYLTKDGSYRWLEWTASPQLERGMLYCVARDITQQKRTKIALQESQIRLRLVNAIAHKVRGGFSVERIVTETLEHLSHYFPHFRISYATVNKKGLLTITHSFKPSERKSLKDLQVDLTLVPNYLQALQENEPVIVANVNRDRHLESLASVLQSYEIQSLLDVPLQHSHQLIGLLSFDLPIPHDWSEHEILTLQEIANYLEVTLQNVEFQTQLKKSEERWQLVLRGSNDGVWDWNVQTNEIFFSSRWKAMLGYQEHEIGDYLSEWATRVHPDDLEGVIQAMQDHFARKTPFYVSEHRLRCKDGSYKWILARSQAIRNEQGTVVRMAGSHTDITERRKLETALLEANARLEQRVKERTAQLEETHLALAEQEAIYRILAQNIPNGAVHLFDHDLRYFVMEGRELEKLGLDKASLLGKTMWEVLPSETCEQLEPLYRAALEGQDSVQEVAYQNQIYEVYILPVRNEQGEITAGMMLTQNMTERKQAEEKLRQFNLLIELSHEPILVWDMEDGIINWNQGSENLYGYTRAEALGQSSHTLLQTVHPIPKAEFLARLERDQQWSGEIKHTIRTGEQVIVESRQQLIEADGRKLVLETNRDVTARRQAEEALRQSEKRYRTLFESMGDGFCVMEVLFDEDNRPIDYRFLEVNPAFEAQTGLREAEGKTARQLIPNLEQHWVEIYGNVVLTGEPIRFENFAEGLNRWFEAYAFPIGQPEKRRVAVLFKDISSRKMLEAHQEHLLQQEQVAREAAETANRIKDEFLTILSHELRTPLNPILGWVKLLQTRKFSETKITEALATIERNARLQTQLIDDLLDVAKILRGKLSLSVTSVNLSSVIQAAIDTVKTAATAKSISIFPILTDIGEMFGDATRLQQIVWNLLLNAIKFTPHGGRVDIWLKRVGDEAEITVKDTGKGISRDFLPHIFESFRQEDASITRKYGGLGLGLALVRQLVEAHGGTIMAESFGEGQGATFTVRFPLVNAETSLSQTDELPKSEFDLAGIRVLAVDDDPDTRELLATLLREYHAEVKTVASAMEVLTSLESFAPDVLVSDIGMPDVNGYSLLQQIRAFPPEQGGNIPAIALTAYAREEDHQLALESGYSTHISKPLDPEQLVQAVASLTHVKSG